jgi:hypothetical protein
MKLIFNRADTEDWGQKQSDMYDKFEILRKSNDTFFVQLGLVTQTKDPKLPNVFFFRQQNKENLLEIRASVGKELTRRYNDPYMDDFKLTLSPASLPTQNQRAYYFGVVLPIIQEYLKEQGNYIEDINELDKDIRGAISDEYGLFKEVTNTISGKTERRYLTLSSAGNKKEVSKYIDAVIMWAAKDLMLEIPYFEN